MAGGIERWMRRSRGFSGMIAVAIVLVAGLADYLTGVEIFLSVFYLLPVTLAVWFVGARFGVLIAVLSVAVWLGGDLAAGARYGHTFVPAWNAAITLAFYLAVVWLLARLRSLHRELEERVRQRTKALTEEMAGRERLEREILDIGERERQRIGHEFHDSLGQHLTATAMAAHVLQGKLAAQSRPEAADAGGLVEMVEQAIELNRQLALGLSPVQMTGEGLMDSLRELAAGIGERTPIRCDFLCRDPVLIRDSAAGMHLYRIAQEAVNNAVKHAKATRIVIRLSGDGDAVTLEVQDDGVGLPEPLPKGAGMGLRIMGYRAAMIHASFAVRRGGEGGTWVTCTLRGQP